MPQIGAELFTNGSVRRISIEISPNHLTALRRAPRQDVPVTIREQGRQYSQVGLHLKGSTGSFRNIDDKPGFTLDFAHLESKQRFHGLRKIHLNNSVEDPSYLLEQIASALFRAAGVPAPRVTHARIELNGRSLGLYVLKEGFSEEFLAGYFNNVNGKLYDTEWGDDIDQFMKPSLPQDSDLSQLDLKALATVARDPDLDRRWRRLQEVLDLDRFFSFMALEIMMCHRDGYCLARNNFRIYHDLDTGKLVFFPHGLDQLFRPPELPWQPRMGGFVAQAILEIPEGKQRYSERFSTLFTNLFQTEALGHQVKQHLASLRPFLERKEYVEIERESALLRERIAQRQSHLEKQLSQPPVTLLQFKEGVARLTGWVAVDAPPEGKMEIAAEPNGLQTLHIVAGPVTSASWRTKALLKRGWYRFEGRCKVNTVKPLPYGKHQGAGLRIASQARESARLIGDAPWQMLTADFEVKAESEEVEFICELRASAGDAWFDPHSLQVRPLPNPP